MSNVQTLNALRIAIEMAERERDAARQGLQGAQTAQQAAQAQLDQLQSYAQETETRWGPRADARLQPQVLHHHYQFMERLQHAAGLQTQVVQGHDAREQQAQNQLIKAEQRLLSLRKLLSHKEREQQQLQARHEQKQTDERALLQHRLRTQRASTP